MFYTNPLEEEAAVDGLFEVDELKLKLLAVYFKTIC